MARDFKLQPTFDGSKIPALSTLGTDAIQSGTFAGRPAAGTNGRLYWATNVNGGALYRDNGTTWDFIVPGAPETLTTETAVTATATETLIGTVGTIRANSLNTGSLIDVFWYGNYDMVNSATARSCQLRLRAGGLTGTQLFGSGSQAVTVSTLGTARSQVFQGKIFVRSVTTRSATTLNGSGIFYLTWMNAAGTATIVAVNCGGTSTVAIDNTADQSVVMTVAWSVATVADVSRVEGGDVQLLH